MRGINFIVDDSGKKTAVIIDLKKHARLWEDLFDCALAEERENEPRIDIETVEKRFHAKHKKT